MKRLLDKADQRMLRILEKLMYEDTWITVKKLADYVDSSIRTVTYDLSFIKNKWNHILNIETSVNYGVKINSRSTGSLSLIAKEIFHESYALNLLSNLFYHPWQTKDELCEKLDISHSLFTQSLKSIRETLDTFDTDVKCKKGKYYISSDNELKLRMLFAGLTLELYDFEPLERQKLLSEVLVELNFISLDADNMDLEFVYMHIFLEVSLNRENQNFVYPCRPETVDFNPKLLKRINKLHPNITMDNIKNISILFNEGLYRWDSKTEEENITQLIEYQIKDFFSKMNIQDNEMMGNGMIEIIKNLYQISKIFDFKPTSLFNRNRYFAKNYQKHNQRTYRFLEEMFMELSRQSSANLNNLLSDIIYWICIYNPEFYYYQSQKKILVVSDLGHSHCQMIKRHLLKRFNTDEAFVEVDCISYEQIQTINENTYDLVITTLPLFKETTSKCIIVNDDINYEVLYEIEKAIYENN